MNGERRIFVTGGAGCVGHYVVERLLRDPGNRPVLLLRDPGRLRADLRERVEILTGDLALPEGFLHLLGEMDAAVLLAAAWGGDEARQVNVWSTWAILDALDPARCRRIVYCSTASLLGADGAVLAAAREHGTGYIQQKYEALLGIPRTRTGERVVTVFPAVVLGGGPAHPWSHAASGLLRLARFAWLLRFLTLDGRFHVVHAHDVARVVAHLLDAEAPEAPVVLGGQPVSVGEALMALARARGFGAAPQLDLTPLVALLPRIVPGRFTTWDRYCLRHRDFTYPVLDLPGLLGPSGYETLDGILAALPLRDARAREPEPSWSPWCPDR